MVGEWDRAFEPQCKAVVAVGLSVLLHHGGGLAKLFHSQSGHVLMPMHFSWSYSSSTKLAELSYK